MHQVKKTQIQIKKLIVARSIYETDNSDGEWFNETISEEFNDAFINLISKSKDKDVWKTEGRPKIYTGSSTRTLCRNKNI